MPPWLLRQTAAVAHLRVDLFSEALGLSTSMTVLLPQSASGQIGMAGGAREGGHPVLYLLHGLSDDDTTWLRRTSIERYVAERGWAVVMPQVHRSFYADEVQGGRFWTFVSDELPSLVHSFFRVSAEREDTFVAGLSMGGYGALKLALHQPGRFAAASSLSGALDVAALLQGGRSFPEDPAMFTRIFGAGGTAGPDDDLLALVRDADPATLPALYACCGTEDELIGANHTFAEACRSAGVDLTTSWSPGLHDWAYWDDRIVDVLAFFDAQRGSRDEEAA